MFELQGDAGLRQEQVGDPSDEIVRASTLQDMTLTLFNLSDRDQLIADAASSAAVLLDAPSAALLLLAPDGKTITTDEVFDNKPGRRPGMRAEVGQGLIGGVAAQNRPLLVNDPAGDSRYDPSVDVMGDEPLSSLLAVPVYFANRLLGVLAVANRPRPFTEQDLRWLQALAPIIGGAYENLQLIEQLREKQERLLEAEEKLRNKLARDIHDGATQRIAAAQMQLEYVKRIARARPEELESEIEEMRQLLGKAMTLLRTALFDLRPLILEVEGIEPALLRYVGERQGRRGASLRLEIAGRIPPMRNRTGGALFAIIQEAVTNADKHAKATEIVIRLEGSDNRLTARIEDNGRGFNADQVNAGYTQGSSFGMKNMQELVEAIQGSFHVESAPGKGTRVVVTVPLHARDWLAN